MRDRNEYFENPALLFIDTADAIREKTGETGLIDAVDYPEKIKKIETTFDYSNNEIISVGDYAYQGMSNLKSVYMPNAQSIGDYAFALCDHLTRIELSNSLSSIGDSAFAWCYKLTDIYIPDSVQNIGNSAFSNCKKLTNVTIPQNITSIDDYVFGWSGLEYIEIPDNIISIGYMAFYNCENLKSITISDNVENIGEQAFARCTLLESIIVNENNINYSSDDSNVLYDKEKTTLLQFPIANPITEYTIANGTQSILSDAFGGCENLQKISMPISITSIGEYAITCRNLTDIIYDGTVDQWNLITFADGWDMDTPTYTIHCTDGDIVKS